LNVRPAGANAGKSIGVHRRQAHGNRCTLNICTGGTYVMDELYAISKHKACLFIIALFICL